MTTINADEIAELIINCGYSESEDTSNAVRVPGISGEHSFGLNPIRLSEAKPEIEKALDSLDPRFFSEDGLPYPLGSLQADGTAWTRNYRLVELLFVVGQAVGKVKRIPPQANDVTPRFRIISDARENYCMEKFVTLVAATADRRAGAAEREIAKLTEVSIQEKINNAIGLAMQYGGIDGAHHKTWVIDQMVRSLAGESYDAIIAEYCAADDDGETYEWDVGIAP
jgi:hypothetical protein